MNKQLKQALALSAALSLPLIFSNQAFAQDRLSAEPRSDSNLAEKQELKSENLSDAQAQLDKSSKELKDAQKDFGHKNQAVLDNENEQAKQRDLANKILLKN